MTAAHRRELARRRLLAADPGDDHEWGVRLLLGRPETSSGASCAAVLAGPTEARPSLPAVAVAR